jgi:hypothetical protein
MNKLSKLIGVAITAGLGIAIYDSEMHSIIGWCLALGYFCCFQLNENELRKIVISVRQIRKMRDEK